MEDKTCANCGAAAQLRYCAHCGQDNRNYQRAFLPMVWDLLREAFELDSRVLRTLKLLVFKPGQLAIEFSNNRRASYVSPIRLYLFISLFFFFALSFNTDFNPPAVMLSTEDSQRLEEHHDISRLLPLITPSQAVKANEIMSSAEPTLKKRILVSMADSIEAQETALSTPARYLMGKVVDVTYQPQLMFNAIMDNLPLALFILLPIYAFILKLLYYGSRRFYVEHLVFATHVHSFVFLVYAVLLMLPQQASLPAAQTALSSVENGLLLILLIYHLTALKRYYGQEWGKTCMKYVTQMALYFTVLIPTAAIGVILFSLQSL